MPVQIQCPNKDCGKTLTLSDGQAGIINCPACQTAIAIPLPASPQQSPEVTPYALAPLPEPAVAAEPPPKKARRRHPPETSEPATAQATADTWVIQGLGILMLLLVLLTGTAFMSWTEFQVHKPPLVLETFGRTTLVFGPADWRSIAGITRWPGMCVYALWTACVVLVGSGLALSYARNPALSARIVAVLSSPFPRVFAGDPELSATDRLIVLSNWIVGGCTMAAWLCMFGYLLDPYKGAPMVTSDGMPVIQVTPGVGLYLGLVVVFGVIYMSYRLAAFGAPEGPITGTGWTSRMALFMERKWGRRIHREWLLALVTGAVFGGLLALLQQLPLIFALLVLAAVGIGALFLLRWKAPLAWTKISSVCKGIYDGLSTLFKRLLKKAETQVLPDEKEYVERDSYVGPDKAILDEAYHLMEKLNYKEALAGFERALVVNPHSGPAKRGFGWCTYKCATWSWPAQEEALRLLDEALKVNPNDGEAFFFKAEILAETDQVAAVKHWQQAIGRPLLRWQAQLAHRGLGSIFAERMQLRQALPFLEKAVQLGWDHFSNYEMLALIYQKKGDVQKAEEAMKQADLKRPPGQGLRSDIKAAILAATW